MEISAQTLALYVLLFSGGTSARAQTGPTITQQPTNQSAVIGGSVDFSVAVSGTAPFFFQWQFNGANLPNLIDTVAVGGSENPGDGGAATNAALSFPIGVAVDAFGNLLISDNGAGVIRMVDTTGIITTLAGGGAEGLGDGGPANNANLDSPTGIAVDQFGDLFIADSGDQRIRKMDTNGIITTVAGNGTNGYSGDGGAATNAELNIPRGVAVDLSGNLFIADAYNQCIRQVSISGIIRTVAGNGTYGYSGDGGQATNANLGEPYGVAVDAYGNLFIADTENSRVGSGLL